MINIFLCSAASQRFTSRKGLGSLYNSFPMRIINLHTRISPEEGSKVLQNENMERASSKTETIFSPAANTLQRMSICSHHPGNITRSIS